MTQTVEVPAEKPRSKLLAAAQHANTNPGLDGQEERMNRRERFEVVRITVLKIHGLGDLSGDPKGCTGLASIRNEPSETGPTKSVPLGH